MKLSIITINLNNSKGLQKTVESVVAQTFKDYEYIVIDGGSVDGSVEIIKQHQSKINYWLSEKDAGIYNAMNKGIKKANGEYCLFLNSGDYFVGPTTVEKCFSNGSKEDIVYCNVIMCTKDSSRLCKPPAKLTFYDFYGSNLCHQSTFIKKELFTRVGFYNEKYKIASDWEFLLKAIFLSGCSTKYLDETIVNYNFEGISSNFSDTSRKEYLAVLNELFPRFIDDYKKLADFYNSTPLYSTNRFVRMLAKVINFIILKKRSFF